MRTSIVALLPPPRLSCQTNKSTAVRLVIINFSSSFSKLLPLTPEAQPSIYYEKDSVLKKSMARNEGFGLETERLKAL